MVPLLSSQKIEHLKPILIFVGLSLQGPLRTLTPLLKIHYLNLFHPGSLEPQIKAVIGQRPNLLVVPVVTDADDRNLG